MEHGVHEGVVEEGLAPIVKSLAQQGCEYFISKAKKQSKASKEVQQGKQLTITRAPRARKPSGAVPS